MIKFITRLTSWASINIGVYLLIWMLIASNNMKPTEYGRAFDPVPVWPLQWSWGAFLTIAAANMAVFGIIALCQSFEDT